MNKHKKILFLCLKDSSLKASSFLCKEFTKRGYTADLFILEPETEQNNRLIADLGLPSPIGHGGLEELEAAADISTYSVVHIISEGGALRRFLIHVHERKIAPRPLILTGLIGVLGGNETLGYMNRQPVDLFYVTGKRDQNILRGIAKSCGDRPERIIDTGLPLFDGIKRRDLAPGKNIKKILFAGQPTFPPSRATRRWVIKSLIDIADANPDIEVVLKPRIRPGETTIHQPRFHFEEFLDEFSPLPSNFEVSYMDIRRLIENSDLLLTISSTAAIEALLNGIEVGFITDFGVSEKYGNHVFLNSGCMRSFEQIKHKNFPAINKKWLDEYINTQPNVCSRIFEETEKALEELKARLAVGHLNPFWYMENEYKIALSSAKENTLANRPNVSISKQFVRKVIAPLLTTAIKFRPFDALFRHALNGLKYIEKKSKQPT